MRHADKQELVHLICVYFGRKILSKPAANHLFSGVSVYFKAGAGPCWADRGFEVRKLYDEVSLRGPFGKLLR